MILDLTCPDCKHKFVFDNWDIDECPDCKKGFFVSVDYIEDIDEEFPLVDWDE